MTLPASAYLRKRRKPEQGLHLAVAQYLNMALLEESGAFWCHVPNGGMRDVVEAALLKRMGTKPGVPDIIILFKRRTYGIELKSLEGRTSTAQKETQANMLRAGAKISICRSVDDVQMQLDKWRIPIFARTFEYSKGPRT